MVLAPAPACWYRDDISQHDDDHLAEHRARSALAG
jgi:hypothetical protein